MKEENVSRQTTDKLQTATDAFEKWATAYYACKPNIIPEQARDAWNAGIASTRTVAVNTSSEAVIADAIGDHMSAGERAGHEHFAAARSVIDALISVGFQITRPQTTLWVPE
jgi:hypothetical protein